MRKFKKKILGLFSVLGLTTSCCVANTFAYSINNRGDLVSYNYINPQLNYWELESDHIISMKRRIYASMTQEFSIGFDFNSDVCEHFGISSSNYRDYQLVVVAADTYDGQNVVLDTGWLTGHIYGGYPVARSLWFNPTNYYDDSEVSSYWYTTYTGSLYFGVGFRNNNRVFTQQDVDVLNANLYKDYLTNSSSFTGKFESSYCIAKYQKFNASLWDPYYSFNILDANDNSYNDGYANGFLAGEAATNNSQYNLGYNEGYDNAIAEYNERVINDSASYQAGVNYGRSTADTTIDIGGTFFSIFDAPVNFFKDMFDVEFFGYNLADTFMGIVAICVFVWLLKFFL